MAVRTSDTRNCYLGQPHSRRCSLVAPSEFVLEILGVFATFQSSPMAPPSPPDSFSNYYSKWDSYAAGLGEDVNDDEMPGSIADQSRPVAEARQQMERQNQVSAQKAAMLAKMKENEMTLEASDLKDDDSKVIHVSDKGLEGKALRLRGVKDRTVLVEVDKILKMFIEEFEGCKVLVQSQLVTGTAELWSCKNSSLCLLKGVETVQCDACNDVSITGAVRVCSSNCTGLKVNGAEVAETGMTEQILSKSDEHGKVTSDKMQRFGHDQLPVMDLGEKTKPSAEKDIAESQKELGNDAFKECDFMQAVVFYTNALDHDPRMAVALSNRAQCWLKLGDLDKAETDALKAAGLEEAPDRIRAKSWFRAGMARHGRGTERFVSRKAHRIEISLGGLCHQRMVLQVTSPELVNA
ncbi:hypothetical protein FOZ60_008371 [Perkinsus olseni]|uniref:Uncharacterized protein n=1 Tax=Perkinsus olseni TaxID=32597 RepID=A0A7J6NJZ8_PEROL|nr:hypothetical protein FOZ60_008371 [Perkinsus olseni]